jgi:hypothetical protein
MFFSLSKMNFNLFRKNQRALNKVYYSILKWICPLSVFLNLSWASLVIKSSVADPGYPSHTDFFHPGSMVDQILDCIKEFN